MTRWQLYRRNLWLHLRRAPQDWRSARVVGGLLYFIAYLTYLAFIVHFYGIGMLLWTGAMLLVATGFAILIARSHRETDKAMLSLAPPRHSIDLPDIDVAKIRSLRQLLFKRAIFVDRAGIEAMIRNGLTSEEHRGISRRRTIELAHSEGIWESLSTSDQELLLSPEGSWKEDEINHRCMWAEDVRAIRWTLLIDEVLTPFEFAELDIRVALQITGGRIKHDLSCLATWDIRSAKNEAARVLERGLAEGTLRGFYDVQDIEGREELIRFAANQANQSDDILVGSETFAGATDDRVKAITQLAFRRFITFHETLSILDA